MQKPAPGSRSPLALRVDEVNAWGSRLQDEAESWTARIAESIPWATTAR